MKTSSSQILEKTKIILALRELQAATEAGEGKVGDFSRFEIKKGKDGRCRQGGRFVDCPGEEKETSKNNKKPTVNARQDMTGQEEEEDAKDTAKTEDGKKKNNKEGEENNLKKGKEQPGKDKNTPDDEERKKQLNEKLNKVAKRQVSALINGTATKTQKDLKTLNSAWKILKGSLAPDLEDDEESASAKKSFLAQMEESLIKNIDNTIGTAIGFVSENTSKLPVIGKYISGQTEAFKKELGLGPENSDREMWIAAEEKSRASLKGGLEQKLEAVNIFLEKKKEQTSKFLAKPLPSPLALAYGVLAATTVVAASASTLSTTAYLSESLLFMAFFSTKKLDLWGLSFVALGVGLSAEYLYKKTSATAIKMNELIKKDETLYKRLNQEKDEDTNLESYSAIGKYFLIAVGSAFQQEAAIIDSVTGPVRRAYSSIASAFTPKSTSTNGKTEVTVSQEEAGNFLKEKYGIINPSSIDETLILLEDAYEEAAEEKDLSIGKVPRQMSELISYQAVAAQKTPASIFNTFFEDSLESSVQNTEQDAASAFLEEMAKKEENKTLSEEELEEKEKTENVNRLKLIDAMSFKRLIKGEEEVFNVINNIELAKKEILKPPSDQIILEQIDELIIAEGFTSMIAINSILNKLKNMYPTLDIEKLRKEIEEKIGGSLELPSTFPGEKEAEDEEEEENL